MAKIVSARAYANNEVAFIAWEIDVPSIPGCLGFHIVREHLDAAGAVVEERSLAAYVAFKGQHNPDWQPQTTAIWPVQKFNWRDLTLRRRRDASGLRPENEVVRYRIRAVGKLKAGMTEVTPASGDDLTHWDPAAHAKVPNTYQGTPIKLGYLTAAATTNAVTATRKRGPFLSTFTNGILSTQFLVHAMEERGMKTQADLETALRTKGDTLRRYFSGDVLTTIAEFFSRADGHFHAALYELNDTELIDLLLANAARLDLILSDAGDRDIKDPVTKKKTGTLYDTTNTAARAKLHAAPGIAMQDRLFNGSGHIGHNKFVIWSDKNGTPRSVLTGSTNWTWSGICGQSNNCIRIDDDGVARAFKDYWDRLHADPLPPVAKPSDPNTKAKQSDALKTADRAQVDAPLAGGGSARLWFSPNKPGKNQPPSGDGPAGAVPPDIADLFADMRKAEHMILFAVFLPSRGGKHSIIEQAIDLGRHDPKLKVIGAISDSTAMWNFQVGKTDASGQKQPAESPHVFEQDGISVVRATALTDKEIGSKPVGDFIKDEILTLGKAIIHDKIVVVDPLDPVKCMVAFGSHNMGYKASYSNDENMVIVRGHPELAQAYAVHILDIFDHYRFRAWMAQIEDDRKKAGTPLAAGDKPEFDGSLSTSDTWQADAGKLLSDYFA